MMMEDSLEIRRFEELRAIPAGCKMYSIRSGHRSFARSIRVFSGDYSIACITNSYTHTTLAEVPFIVLEAKGFRNLKEALDTLRTFYPEIEYESKVTIVEYRLAI